ncbi:MAG: pilus assembly protein [Planctomycetaceae bacterium]|nr:pilus assembly protein [Planctomycetaceae bacterium]
MKPLVRSDRRIGPADAPLRRGVAAVEFAVCLPVMLLITFGAIEAANGIYLKQILTQAAYEGARVASTVGATQSEAEAFSQLILDSRSIQNATINITPTINANTPSGTEVTVIVTAPSNSNAFAPLWYFRDAQVRAQIVMVRN